MVSRIEIDNGQPFDEREWLRREVLWAALVSPYTVQVATWLNGTAYHQHMSNFSRATLYAEAELDVEMQAMSFFNQGKNIAGILSSASLFRVLTHEKPRNDDEEISEITLMRQAQSIDMALSGADSSTPYSKDKRGEQYIQCQDLMSTVEVGSKVSHKDKLSLLKAAKIMTRLAMPEIAHWRKLAYQNQKANLPTLVIPNGGHARSAGPRIEKYQPVLHTIIASEEYQVLQKSPTIF